MRTTNLGASGITASVIGLGTWAIGGWGWGGTREQESIAAIQASIDLGVTLIDTAPAYGLGLSEELIGKAIRGRRQQVQIATKCSLVWDRKHGSRFFEENGQDIYRCLTPDAIQTECEASLRRLGVEIIDLYQTHWPDDLTAIEDTVAALLALRTQGKIRAIGASNVSAAQMSRYRAAGAIDTDQEQYNLIDRTVEQEQLPWCRQHRTTFLAYSAMARGLLSGSLGPDRALAMDDHRRSTPAFSVENRRLVQNFLGAIQPVADRHQLTLGQLALAWVVNQPGNIIALAGARNVHQAQENARAGSVVLDATDLAAIKTALETHLKDFDQRWYSL
jgi:methylglyoxal reductase